MEKYCWSERIFQPSNWHKTKLFSSRSLSPRATFSLWAPELEKKKNHRHYAWCFVTPLPCQNVFTETSFGNQILSILYDGLVVYPEFNVKVTNVSVRPEQCRNLNEFAIFFLRKKDRWRLQRDRMINIHLVRSSSVCDFSDRLLILFCL